MRIVFGFYGTPQATGNVRAYSTTNVRAPSEWRGTQCDVMVVDAIDWADDEKRREGDALHLEGRTESVRQALKSLLRILDASEKLEKERTLKRLSEEVQCPTCRYYVHPRDEWHADGFGNRCGTPESLAALRAHGIVAPDEVW